MAKVVKQGISRAAFEVESYDNLSLNHFFNDSNVQNHILNESSALNTFIADNALGWNAFVMVCTNMQTLVNNNQKADMESYITLAKTSTDTAELYQAGVDKAFIYCTDTARGYGVSK